MIRRKVTVRASDGKAAVVCEIEIFFKERNIFFYGKSSAEILSMDVPGWFKSALGEGGWDYVKTQLNNMAEDILDGYNGMVVSVKY